ncbi:SLC13 family permease [Arthrobacter sp. CAN_C5]|uniref:SLC13 family permease n=1 Tax=Arthrobacter sp. CAN_C5 TaxID=2760706 RepID=UPI001AEA9C47|nr:SLC13 family permease [Arthrobacter sp. CAN_C5]MBP2217222.1 di/tricarboxylate transporter [Arthrobacter sp. CAN_C5]
MSVPLLSIIILAAMFLIATLLPVNMGALAFVGAFLLGAVFLGMETDDIIANFPGGLFLTLVGVTYLFAIAQNNGTIDLLVNGAVKLVRSRVALIPWIMFIITGVITAVGALGPAAVAIMAPVALGFAAKHKISPLLMGMMVVHGAQAGGFSPIAVYGVIVNGIVADTGFDYSPLALFLSSLIFNFLIAVVLFLVLGGRKLFSARVEQFVEGAADARMRASVGARASGADVDFRGTGSGTDSLQGKATSGNDGGAVATDSQQTLAQYATIAGLIILAVVALGFKVDVGFVAITVAVALALISPRSQKGAVEKISWSTVLLICGMLTFVGVLQEAGTIEYVSDGVASLGMPLLAALLICYIGAVVSAFASSTAILAALIPLAIPFLESGEIGAIGVIAALSIASTVVDVSPFSTNGALVLANAPEGTDRDRFYKQILAYGGIIVVVGPLVAWLVLVVPGWL